MENFFINDNFYSDLIALQITSPFANNKNGQK